MMTESTISVVRKLPTEGATPTPGHGLYEVSRLLRRRYEQELKTRQVGITYPQARVLLALARQEGINQATLAQGLEMEPITLVRVIDRLETAKLVERRRDPQDRRAWTLYLTPLAKPLTEQIGTLGWEIWEQAMTGLDAGRIDMFVATLTHLKGKLVIGLSQEEGGEIGEAANG